MKQRIFGLALCCFFSLLALAQRGNIWYFGFNAGITFNTVPPTALTNGQLSTNEGCASIADGNGALLFYTNGETIYNKNHQIMANGTGLLGHWSSTQSSIIVPYPGNDNLYYVITCGDFTTKARGYNYSIVDISRNGGLGEVTVKNQLLYQPSSEKLTVASHANGVDWWVITKPLYNNLYYCYLITANGINTAPIISAAGKGLPIGSDAAGIGCLRVSPDGKKLAMTGVGINPELMDFNNTTGMVGGGVSIKSYNSPLGIEFSPNSRFLYISFFNPPQIDQFDVTAYNDSASLEATRIKVTPAGYTTPPRGMQVGPDEKIYIVAFQSSHLDVIHNPDNSGISCNFQPNSVSLNSRLNGLMLPNIIPNLLSPFSISLESINVDYCNRKVRFNAISNQTRGVTYKWNFGNGTTSNEKEIEIQYDFSQNNFIVSLEINADVPVGGGSFVRRTRTLTKTIQFDTKPEARFSLINNCGDKAAIFTNASTIPSGTISGYHWDFGDGTIATAQDLSHTFPSFGEHLVKLVAKSPAGCPSDTLKQTVLIKANPVARIEARDGCEGQAVSFTDQSSVEGSTISSRLWTFPDGSSITGSMVNKTFSIPGTYTINLQVQGSNGCTSTPATKSIVIGSQPTANAGNDTTVMAGTPFQLRGSGEGSTYRWSPSTYLNNATLIHPTATLQADQIFTLEVSNNGCIASDQVKVTVVSDCVKPLAAFTPNGDGLNDVWVITTSSCLKYAKVKVYNRYGSEVFESQDYKNNWDGTYKGQLLPDGTYYYIGTAELHNGKTLHLRGNVTVLR